MAVVKAMLRPRCPARWPPPSPGGQHLGVAPPRGMELRQAGIEAPCLVMGNLSEPDGTEELPALAADAHVSSQRQACFCQSTCQWQWAAANGPASQAR